MQWIGSIAGINRAFFLFAATCMAAGAQAQGTAAAASQAAEQPVIRTHSNLVLVDVVVTDHGTPVQSLDRSHFHVLEDGHEQKVTSFDERRTPASQTSIAAKQPGLPPHTYSNAPLYPEGSAFNVLLLDGLNTPMEDQMNVRQKMIAFMGKIPPGTSLAIFTLSSRLRMVQQFTTNAGELAKALQSAKGSPQPSVVLDPQGNQALDSTLGNMASITNGMSAPPAGGESALSAMQQFEADLTAFQTDQRVRMTLDAMQQLARYLSGVPGRKNLVWFSGSFPISLDPDEALADPFEAMRNYSNEIRDTTELLASARVAVYPVDARGLMTPPSFNASYTPSTNLVGATVSGGRGGRSNVTVNRPSPSNDDIKAQKQLMAEQASMQQIADATGGQPYMNTNGLVEAIASAIRDGSSYYTIGYTPAGQLDGQYHKIQIKVDGREVKLAYRRGYYADPPDKPSSHASGETSLITAATLHGAPPATQILFETRVLPATDGSFQGVKLPAGKGGEMNAQLKGPLQRMMVDLKIDAHTLFSDTAADGDLHAKIEFALVAYDGDGRRVNYLDSGFQLGLKQAQIRAVMNSGIHLRLPFDLPPGQYSLRVAVHDLEAGRAGSIEVPVTVGAVTP